MWRHIPCKITSGRRPCWQKRLVLKLSNMRYTCTILCKLKGSIQKDYSLQLIAIWKQEHQLKTLSSQVSRWKRFVAAFYFFIVTDFTKLTNAWNNRRIKWMLQKKKIWSTWRKTGRIRFSHHLSRFELCLLKPALSKRQDKAADKMIDTDGRQARFRLLVIALKNCYPWERLGKDYKTFLSPADARFLLND